MCNIFFLLMHSFHSYSLKILTPKYHGLVSSKILRRDETAIFLGEEFFSTP